MRCLNCNKNFWVTTEKDWNNAPNDTASDVPEHPWYYCPICGARVK